MTRWGYTADMSPTSETTTVREAYESLDEGTREWIHATIEEYRELLDFLREN